MFRSFTFWAASDLLEIEEIKTEGKSDFKLYKMKDLPPDAQSFERIMFDGLFEDDDEILVSDTRNSLYTTMRKAHKDLKRFGKKYRFWVAGTRELGIAMIIFGMLLGAVGLLTLGFSAAARDFSYAVPILIGAIALIGFGIIMPRKSKMGTEVYHELLSFREVYTNSQYSRSRRIVSKGQRLLQSNGLICHCDGAWGRMGEKV